MDSSHLYIDITQEQGTGTLERSITQSIRASLPKTRYYGSKLRLIDGMAEALSGLRFNTVLDAFGGTATVSLLFKLMGKTVSYNDLLKANCLAAQGLLGPARTSLPQETIGNFHQLVKPQLGFISKTFEEYFYSETENRWLDGAAVALHRLSDPQEKADIFYCLAQACLQKRPFNLFHRKNLYIRQNCSKETAFGNWRTWERSFPELMQKAAGELAKAKKITAGTAIVMPPQNVLNISNNYDLVYLDPPYIKKEKNDLHYLDRYHFLEGLAISPNWLALIDTTSKIKSLTGYDEIAEWNEKDNAKRLMFELIEKYRTSVVAFSYAYDGHPSVPVLLKHFKGLFSDVLTCKHKISHALKKGAKKEILIIGIPK